MSRKSVWYQVALLSACVMCFSACQDNDGATGHGKKSSETCQPTTFKSSCVDDGQAVSVCELTSKGFVPEKKECSDKQACIEYDGKAECAAKCQEEGEVLSESCAQVRDGAAALKSVAVKVVCTRLDDGQLYGIKEETDCNGICYDGKCAELGDPCNAKTRDIETVLGCNGRALYVCDRERVIRRKLCQKKELCQMAEKDDTPYYYCAAPCEKASGTGNICAVGQIAAIPTKCVEFSDKEIYKVNVDSAKLTVDSGAMYCDDGSLKSLPHSTCCAGKLNCADECYGNVALTRFDPDQRFRDCAIGMCHVDKTLGFHECMQPCEKVGDQIKKCGAMGYSDDRYITLLECVQFDDGLYYKTEDVSFCQNGCIDGECR